MRLVTISDTHGLHEELGTLEGDVLIHCGDSCDGFTRDPDDVVRLDDWFSRQRFELVLCIGGNHDFEIERRARRSPQVFENAVYLEDAAIEYEGCRFYGAPWVPQLSSWAFYHNNNTIRAKWAAIPSRLDVLITHTAPFGILDRNRFGQSLGCENLRDRLQDIRPRLHVFGHNHASAGTLRIGDTLHANASMVNSQYQICRPPFQFEIDVRSAAPVKQIIKTPSRP
jgi:Icc-related predicted phosphoesterase